jgi:hypothetical protein
MADGGNTLPRIVKAEHIGPDDTGDNINAKRVVPYSWDGTNWGRSIFGMFSLPYDELDWSNADGSGNYQTITSKLASATQQTLTLSYDGNNNVTSIKRA